MEERKLVMTFKNTLGNNFSLTVMDPREDIEEEEIAAAMALVLAKNIFQPKGHELAVIASAKVVESATTSYDLDI